MTTETKIINNKLGWLRLGEMLGNVSLACKVIGEITPSRTAS